MDPSAALVSLQRLAILALAAVILPASAAAGSGERADAGAPDGRGRMVGGLFLHDRGPTADRHEDGYDINLEYQFAPPDAAPWRLIGSPRPHVGATVSLNGETSLVYSGLTYEADLPAGLSVSAHGGLAVHDGMLHQDDEERCSAESDCGFGSRVLFRGGLELGIDVGEDRSVSLFWDHMSHGELLASENEGIDHIGVRYAFAF